MFTNQSNSYTRGSNFRSNSNKRSREYDVQQESAISKRILDDGIRSLSLEQQFLVESTTSQPSINSNNNNDSEIDNSGTMNVNQDVSIEQMSANYGDSPTETNDDDNDDNDDNDGESDTLAFDENNYMKEGSIDDMSIPYYEVSTSILPSLKGKKHTRKVDFLIDNLIRKERRLLELHGSNAYRDGYMLDGSDVCIPHSVGPTPTVDQALLSAYRWPVVCDSDIWMIDTSGSMILINNSKDNSLNTITTVDSSKDLCSSVANNSIMNSTNNYQSTAHEHKINSKIISPINYSSRHSNNMTHSDWIMEMVDDISDESGFPSNSGMNSSCLTSGIYMYEEQSLSRKDSNDHIGDSTNTFMDIY